jgi:O-antigen/teichoic acid export membrane protein
MVSNLIRTALRRAGMESTIARNSLFLLASEVLARALSLVVSVMLFRYLKPEGAGTLRFVVSYGILFAVVAEMGISRAAVRQMAREHDTRLRALLGDISMVRSGLNAMLLLLIWLSLLVPPGSRLDPTTRILVFLWSWSLVFQANRRNSEIVFQGLQRMHYHGLFLVMNRLVALVLMVGVIVARGGLVAVMCAYLVADLVDWALSAWFVRRHFARPSYSREWLPKLALLAAGFPFALQLFAGQIYYYLDTVMLKYLLPRGGGQVEAEIGLYSSAYQVVLTFLFVPVSVCNAVFPALSRAFHEDRARMRSLFAHTFGFMALAGMPMAVAFFSLRSELLPLLFGKAFRPAVPMLAVVVWALPLVFVNTALGTLLAASDRQRMVTIASFAGTAFKVAINCFLIPRFGGFGTSAALVVTEAFSLALLLLFVSRTERGVFEGRTLAGIAALHACGAGALLWADGGGPGMRVLLLSLYLAACGLAAKRLIARRRAGA